jgi:thiol-disulfide isomerase/thioredoxin
VQELGGRASFVVENYGDSELARRYGVTRYPAIFVDDVLVATPKDFGFLGEGEGSARGRYAPLHSAEAHQRFRADLLRAIELVAAGRADAARALVPGTDEPELPPLPPGLSFETLDGRRVTAASLAGRLVVVEHWATWCPPCRSTLGWLAELAARHPEDLVVIAVALESDEVDVRELGRQLGSGILWTMEDEGLRRAFGEVTAVPTLRVFGRDGEAAAAFFGAPPDLHQQLATQLMGLLDTGAAAGGG